MESYKLQIKPSASKELELVGSKKDRQRIVSRIHSLSDVPRPSGCEKLTAEENKYRIRQGNYRIVYSIKDQQRFGSHYQDRSSPRGLPIALNLQP